MNENQDTTYLLFVLSDIRKKSGVGAKPMLSELADAIAEKLDAVFCVIEVLCEQERRGMEEALENSKRSSQDDDASKMSFWSTKANRHGHALSILKAVKGGVTIGRIPRSDQVSPAQRPLP